VSESDEELESGLESESESESESVKNNWSSPMWRLYYKRTVQLHQWRYIHLNNLVRFCNQRQ